MRKVILAVSITLDGFIAGPANELDWISMSQDIDNTVIPELLSNADACLIGRVLFQDFEKYWPNAETLNPSISKGELEFAGWIEKSPKIVFSRTLNSVQWNNSRLVKGNISEEVMKLKEQSGGDLLLFGGVRTAQSFVSLRLIDEFRLLVSPVILGDGKSLFQDNRNRLNLELVKSKTFSNGAVQLTYKPK